MEKTVKKTSNLNPGGLLAMRKYIRQRFPNRQANQLAWLDHWEREQNARPYRLTCDRCKLDKVFMNVKNARLFIEIHKKHETSFKRIMGSESGKVPFII